VLVARLVSVALVSAGPILMLCSALCFVRLRESNVVKAPLFVDDFQQLGSVQKWQQDKEGLILSISHFILARNSLAHTPYSSQNKKGPVQLLSACFGLISPAILPARCCCARSISSLGKIGSTKVGTKNTAEIGRGLFGLRTAGWSDPR
jgi:hypothetical protein